VYQPPATTSADAPAQLEQASQPTDAAAPPTAPGFGARGRLRRRARFLRKARELAYRDLGGLVYSLHRFGQRNDSLVLAKLATLTRVDAELRALESSLSERQPVTVLREAGITACPRCAAIHSGEDRFCPNCGLPLSRNVDLPIAGAAAEPAPAAAPPTASAGAAAAPASPPQPAATVSFARVPPAQAPPPAGAPPGASAPPIAAPTPVPGPATQAHPATQTQPATQAQPVGSPAAGRSPAPPAKAPERGEDDQPTEIIRPPATGS
jgi:hypothetical protein